MGHLARIRHLEHWLGRHVTLGLRARVLNWLTSGSVARNSRWQCGWCVVCVRARRWRNACSHVGREQRCTHIHGERGSVEPRAQCQRMLHGRGSCCLGQSRLVAKARRQGPEHERKERENVNGQRQFKRTITLLHLSSPAT